MRIKSGPSQGHEYPIRQGAIVGRADVEIHINDQKISGRHARVDSDAEGNLVLVDLGSTNGLKVNDKRLAKVDLTPGIVILIGKTEVEIIKDTTGKKKETPPPLPSSDDEATRAPVDDELTRAPNQTVDIPLNRATWSEFFSNFVANSLEKIKSKPRALLPFEPMLSLTIFRGIQIGTEWEIGYGPRSVGSGSFEFQLAEPTSPKEAFTLTPKGLVAQFSTRHPGLVLLNGKSISTESLKDGDVISLGDTHIRVSYQNDADFKNNGIF